MPDLYDATDADYNAASRAIIAKIEIFFDATPVTVTKDDYLIDYDVLEEVGSDSNDNPLGNTSANEFSFALLNKDGIFNPTNASGPYYGKIRSGIKIIPYIRTSATNFIQLGVYYVNEWLATVTSLQATISCYDALNAVFIGAPARPAIQPQRTYAQSFDHFMTSVGRTADVDATLTTLLDWWYIRSANKTTLQELSTASMSGCYCGRDGTILVRNMTTPKEVRAILTDQDQLISADISSSLNKEYDGVFIVLNRHQLTELQELLNVKDFELTQGTLVSPITQFNVTPVVRIEAVNFNTKTPNCQFRSYIATPYEITYTLQNNNLETAIANLIVYGRSLEIAKSEFMNTGNNPLQLDNVYVQTPAAADIIEQVYTEFTESDLPFLDISIRGNPLLQLGDKITVQSTKYALNFTGYILRQQFTYTGALRAQLRLIDSRILEV
jgi:hypothetical protein